MSRILIELSKISIKLSWPPCLTLFHICRDKPSQIPMPGVQGVPIPTCVVCGHEHEPTFYWENGEIRHMETIN